MQSGLARQKVNDLEVLKPLSAYFLHRFHQINLAY
jgi:hypothetical protein